MKQLELVESEHGWTQFLGGWEVHSGQDLELLLEGGVWVLGRLEWSGDVQHRPTLYVACGGPWEEQSIADTMPIPPEVVFAIPKGAFLRWPQDVAGAT